MNLLFTRRHSARIYAIIFLSYSSIQLLADSTPHREPNIDRKNEALDYIYNKPAQENTAAGTLSEDYQASKAKISSRQQAMDSILSGEYSIDEDFERFLNLEHSNELEVAKYQDLYSMALKQLNLRKPADAFAILLELSEFDWDGGISKQIANRIRAVWDTDVTARNLLLENDRLHSAVKTASWNVDGYNSLNDDQKTNRKPGTNRGALPNSGQEAATQVTGSLKITEEYFKSIDSKARIKLNEIRVNDIKTKARIDLVEYIDFLFSEKHFHHVILAAEFYQAVFKDGELPQKIASHSTTAISRITDTNGAVEVFKFKVEQRELSSASKILLKAWKTAPYTHSVLLLRREPKLRVVAHEKRILRLKNLIEARDFERLEALLSEIEDSTSDYDLTKPRALVQAVKLDAKIGLAKAQLFAQQGDTKGAMAEFKRAAETWPGNPDLEKVSTEYFRLKNVGVRNMAEFDRLYASGDYTTITERQIEFLPVVQNDAVRQAQILEALTKVHKSSAALEKADMQSQAGDDNGAWETIERALEEWSGDPRLSKVHVTLSSRSPEFVSAIKRAENAEKERRFGASLSLFALARHQYPSSAIANAGLKRVSNRILQDRKDVPDAPTKIEDAGTKHSEGKDISE